MPNLIPPVVNAKMAREYYTKIKGYAKEVNPDFEPLMTLYLTDNTSPEDIIEARESKIVKACKLYPAGATTNSDSGVTDIKKIYPTLAEMERQGLVLCIHGEVTNQEVDVFDREAVFIEKKLKVSWCQC